jgi:superoxide dismutase, Cu-Zn family
MIRTIATALLCFALSSPALFAQDSPRHAPRSVAVNIIGAQGQSVGTALLSEAPNGVNIKLDVRGLAPGPHLMHIHQFAKCEPPDFKSAGSHFNPTGAGHSDGNHGLPAGDIPNFVLNVRADGAAHTSVVAPGVTMGDEENSVFTNGGTAIVIHEVAREVTASAPPRIACGAITRPQ